MPWKRVKPVIVGFILQGRAYVLMNGSPDCDEPETFLTIGKASEFVSDIIRKGHMALKAAESIVITNLDTGESHVHT